MDNLQLIYEDWRYVPRYEGLYIISNRGRVIAMQFRWQTLNPYIKKSYSNKAALPYLSVKLSKDDGRKAFTVHRLVLLAFIGEMPADCQVVRHLNDNPQDNRLWNLAYGTQSQNIKESFDKGRSNANLQQLRAMNKNANLNKQKAIVRIDTITGETTTTISACEMARQSHTNSTRILSYCRKGKLLDNKYLFRFLNAS